MGLIRGGELPSLVSSVADDVANAIQELPEVSAVGGSRPYSVIREWVPEVSRELLTHLEIRVAPEGREARMISRGCISTTFSVLVAIIEPQIEGAETDQSDFNHSLIDAIIQGLVGKRLPLKGALCLSAEQPAVVSVEHWREYRQFASFIRFTLEL